MTMKKNTLTLTLILCAVLAAALLLTGISLTKANAALEDAQAQIQSLTAQVQALEQQNQSLQAQPDSQSTTASPIQTQTTPVDTTDFYCTLVIDDWTVQNGILAVDAFAQAYLDERIKFSAQLELWRGDAVLEAQEVLLDLGEAEGMFEADIVGAAFSLPEITVGEELQLWLMVKPSGSNALFSCGAGWYLEDGQLMLITG